MSEPTMPSRNGSRTEIRALRRDLALARDEQIRRVVAMVDAMAERGTADELIVPLRPRLAQLRIRRPLAFGRLLCMPLNPVIVPGPAWRRDQPAVPRTALPVFIRQVQAGDPALVAEISAAIAGATTDDQVVVLAAGCRLWSAASDLLAAAGVPADWKASTGLAAADHAHLRAAVVLVLRHAATIAGLVRQGTPEPDIVSALLQQAADEDAADLPVLIAVLLGWLPGAAGAMLSVMTATNAPGGPAGRAAGERAIEFTLERIDAELPVPDDLGGESERLRRTVLLLEELDSRSQDRPGRAARVAQTRQRLDAACRDRFDAFARRDLGDDLATAPGTEATIDLEARARSLRRFGNLARRLGGADHYDRELRRMAEVVATGPGDDPLVRIDRVRMAEILVGPEQALAMLEAAAAPAGR